MTQLTVSGQAVLNIQERDVSKQIIAALQYSGWKTLRNSQNAFSLKGYSDYTIIRDGEVIFLELKRPKGGKQTKNQVKFQHDIEEHGGRYMIARSLEDIESLTIGYIKF